MNDAIQSPNSRRRFTALAAAMWLALPFTIYRYWSVWERLPARMATHFGADGRPNGWMTPQESLTFDLVMLLILLGLFTGVLLYTARDTRRLGVTAWSVLGLFYVIVGVVTYICDALLQYNVTGTAIRLGTLLTVLIGGVLIFSALSLGAQRGSELSASTRVSEETHSSHKMALFLAVPAAFLAAIGAKVPAFGLKLTLSVAALAVLAAAAMAWHGFHYFFTTSGVEVRTLGFRLRSIRTEDIQSYAADNWTALGGYGIRGVGDTRAYIWGNSGVRIKTKEGQVFLGHSEPGRLIHDLDLITNHKGREEAHAR